MKKRLLAVLLAAVMVAALLPTAFAADAELPGITLSIDLPGEERTFTLRDWDLSTNTSDADNPNTYTKTAARVVTVSDCTELPLGVTLTIHTYDPFVDEEDYDPMDAVPNSAIDIQAWSDPDGGGVYDKRIAANWVLGTDKEDSILPASTQGPVNGYALSEWFYVDDYNPPEDAEFKLTPSGDSWRIPSTVQLTSDYLVKLFGGDTFIEISVAMGPQGFEYYHYLLTGKDAAEEPDETEEPTEPETPATGFDDVPAGIWYEEAVQYAVDHGLMAGSGGKFDPETLLNRGMLVTVLARVDGVDTDGSSPWYQKGMDWAKEKNVSDGTAPERDITREELALMLWRYADRSTDVDVSILDKYPDGSSVDTWSNCQEAMAWAVENGIIKGSGGYLNPLGTATRMEAVTMIYRYCVNILGEE